MKKILLALLFFMPMFLLTSSTLQSSGSKYDIAKIYEAVSTDYGTKILTNRGNLEDVGTLLVPTTLHTGTYKVEVTRKAQNLYKVEGYNIYIETRYCYEYAIRDNAIIDISGYSYNMGTIVFL